MIKLGFLFPGQGAQHPGMGREMYDNYPEATAVFDRADKIAGFQLSRLCFEGPDTELNKTEFAQPALLICSMAVVAVLKKRGIIPVLSAGLSLGEYTALAAAGKISLEKALLLVMNRARIMQQAVPEGQGAMAAVIGLPSEKVLELCLEMQGIVEVANYNCPGQVVISGQREAVEFVAPLLKAKGGRVFLLAVSVPSHCSLMYDAAIKFKPYLEQVKWQKGNSEVISNVNALPHEINKIPEMLARQLYSPVLWEQSMRYMLKKVDGLIEVGPGSSLSGLVRKIDRQALLGNVNNIVSLENLLEKVETNE